MIWNKIILTKLLLLALWLLKDEDSKRMAVSVALERHPPALRVFRALFEISLILFGVALSCYIWTEAVGRKVLAQLLFRPPISLLENGRGTYQRISTADNTVGHDNDDDDDDDDNAGLLQGAEMELTDADYARDGELSSERSYSVFNQSGIEAKPPTPLEITEIAIDLFLWVLLFLSLFTISSAGGGRYIEGMHGLTESQIMGSIAAPFFPLLLFVGALIRTILPWKKRKSLWIIIFTTVGAPFCSVTFRDGFVGDVLTSSVRPMQDLAFTTFYLLSGLQGWWTEAYDLDDAALPIERSWIVRTVVLPACMVCPLWWRFNQNLRQVWDAKKRWPYLGNALKYLAAAQVAMFGVFDPTRRTSPIWLFCAILATLYQIWWDVVMDWDLIRLERRSSIQIRLREQRLYQSKKLYWTILIINIILRFGWTMTFLPQRFLDRTGVLQRTFEGIFIYIDPLLASAEIFRRTLWGFIRLELEAINVYSDDPKVNERLRQCSSEAGDIELQSMEKKDRIPPPSFDGRDMKFNFSNDLGEKSNVQIMLELCLWTGVFSAGAIVAAVHRATY
jgi:EXS family